MVIGFLHTAPAHVATFESLLRAADANVASRHAVEVALLDDARAAGGVTPAVAARVAAAVQALVAGGAAVVLCTCSTIAGAAEATAVPPGVTVLRVDRPMAERAVSVGSRVAVVAALATTLSPTAALLRDAAQRAGRAIDIVEILCGDAWTHFERGDGDAYLAEIRRAITRAALAADVVVLAQASMAAAAEQGAWAVPVLGSPRLGVDAALRAYRNLSCPTSA